MATPQISQIIQHLRRSVLPDGGGMTDGQLLKSFLHERTEAPLAALVRRHGPMVWGVCCRLLRSHQDAEDAFQATFLVLVQKAAGIRDQEMVGNWLFGVAQQTAVRMRAIAAKRGVREKQVTEMPEPAVLEREIWSDLQPVLDQELGRLPDKYRALIVLCDLEGKTRKEVALQLHVPEGTVAGRLARARAKLAARLARRGVVVSAGSLAAILPQQAALACVPTTVIASTIKTAANLAAGPVAAGAISPTVAVLMTGVMQAMRISKIKGVATILLAVGLVIGAISFGIGLSNTRSQTVVRPAETDGDGPKALPRVDPPKTDKKEQPAGPRVNGLQLTLSADNTEAFISKEGKTEKPVALKLTFTNVSDKAIKFNSYDFIWSLIKGEVKALPGDSIAVQRIAADRIPTTPKVEDFPEIKPGDIWTFEKNLAFPGTIPEGGSTFAQYVVVKPGEFRVKFTYTSAKGLNSPFAKDMWVGELVSNELVITVKREQPKKEAAGPIVNGLQLSLSTDKTETFISKDGKTEKPITFKLTFTNVSDKAIKFNAFDYTFSRIKGEVKALPADSLNFTLKGPGRVKITPQDGDFFEIKPGQSWSHAKSFDFPGTIIAGSSMFARYTVLKPGEFRVKFIYNSPRDDSPFAKDMWIGELVSNEVVITVKAEAPSKE